MYTFFQNYRREEETEVKAFLAANARPYGGNALK
jgi:hypothetical protein